MYSVCRYGELQMANWIASLVSRAKGSRVVSVVLSAIQKSRWIQVVVVPIILSSLVVVVVVVLSFRSAERHPKSGVNGQTGYAGSSIPAPHVKRIVTFSTASLERVPVPFVGTKVEDLYDVLMEVRDKTPKTSQFETTTEYTIRAYAVLKSLGISGHPIDSLFAFDGGGVGYYDAEKERFSDSIFKCEMESSNTSDKGTYTGQNAFGAKALITRKLTVTHTVCFTNAGNIPVKKNDFRDGSFGCRWNWCSSAELNLDWPKANARIASDHLKIVYLVTLDTSNMSWIGDDDKLSPADVGKEYKEPTIDDPVEMTTVKFIVYANLAAIIIYNDVDGHIVKVISVPSSAPKRPH